MLKIRIFKGSNFDKVENKVNEFAKYFDITNVNTNLSVDAQGTQLIILTVTYKL